MYVEKSRNTFYRKRNDIYRKTFIHAKTKFNNEKKQFDYARDIK